MPKKIPKNVVFKKFYNINLTKLAFFSREPASHLTLNDIKRQGHRQCSTLGVKKIIMRISYRNLRGSKKFRGLKEIQGVNKFRGGGKYLSFFAQKWPTSIELYKKAKKIMPRNFFAHPPYFVNPPWIFQSPHVFNLILVMTPPPVPLHPKLCFFNRPLLEISAPDVFTWNHLPIS